MTVQQLLNILEVVPGEAEIFIEKTLQPTELMTVNLSYELKTVERTKAIILDQMTAKVVLS